MSLLPDNVCLESQNLPGGRNCRNVWLRNLHLRDGQAQPRQGHQVDFNGVIFIGLVLARNSWEWVAFFCYLL